MSNSVLCWSGATDLLRLRENSEFGADLPQYIDTLLSDLGINTTRKSNVLANTFLPYYPKHYRGLTDEFQEAQSKKQAGNPYPSATGANLLVLLVLSTLLCAVVLQLCR